MNIYNIGEQIFLFAKFDNSFNSSFITEPVVKIIFLKNDELIEILNEKMETNNYIEYYYNFKLPLNLDFGQYQIIYSGYANGKENNIYESFYVMNNSNDMNPIRIFGYIFDSKNHKNINDVEIQIINNFDNITYYTISNLIGQWECYLQSGEYKFIFKKKGYKSQEVVTKINDSLQNIEFNNIVMEKTNDNLLGNGIFEISDQYIMKNGQPLENLDINIYDVNDLNNMLVKTKTNDDGRWYAYLNSGLYLLKIFGNVFNKNYNKMFRLKIKNNGEFSFEDISNNTSSEQTIFYSNGDGIYKYIDYIYDKNNKPISDVQVNILKNKNDILYQYYTDLEGKFEFNLDKGKYNFEFYHPSFKTINKIIDVTDDFIGEKIKED